jgi:hypothetical protein
VMPFGILLFALCNSQLRDETARPIANCKVEIPDCKMHASGRSASRAV